MFVLEANSNYENKRRKTIFILLCFETLVSNKEQLKSWYVVYFDQHLDAAHSKCWSKYAFLHFLQKIKKRKQSKKIEAKSSPKFFEFAPNCC